MGSCSMLIRGAGSGSGIVRCRHVSRRARRRANSNGWRRLKIVIIDGDRSRSSGFARGERRIRICCTRS